MAWLMRTATLGTIRNFKTTAGELVGAAFAGPAATPGAQGTILGAPVFVDPGVAAIGGSAKSVLFGDFSRYFVRIAGGIRFQRSEDFAFQNDLISFRTLIRLDAALVDTNAIKVYQGAA